MPKIIENIEEIIFNNAKDLFCTLGYADVDMKAIARKCNIAVGTLYNYYPNKKTLYLKTLKKSWENTLEKIKNIDSFDMSDEDRLKSKLKILYEDIENRRGLGKQIQTAPELNDDAIKNGENEILTKIKNLLFNLDKKSPFENDEDIDEKLVYCTLLNTSMLVERFPNSKEQNLQFIYNSIFPFIKIKGI